MTEQWFLDLDGVRSGPYQTSEVMSLIAEGEVLPHHQISSDLKGESWMTLLEWRLKFGAATEPAVKEPPPYEASPVIPEPIPELIPKKPVLEPKIDPAPTIPVFQKIQEPPRVELTESMGAPKRDPMAEMFDMLQNTKHKREVKSQHAHAQAHAHAQTPPAPTPSSVSVTSISKTIIIAGLITLVGFTLGQFFKKESTPDSRTQSASESRSRADVAAPAVENPSTLPDEPPSVRSNELMDRSTDKITIVDPSRSLKSTPVPPPPSFTNKAETSEDLKELKELKKELMELKALKEEIKNSGDSELTPMDGDAPLMETYSDDPQGIKKANPDGKPDLKTEPSGESDIHY